MGAENLNGGAMPGARRQRTSPAKLHRHRLEALRALLSLVESLSDRDQDADPAPEPAPSEASDCVQVAPERNRLSVRLAGLVDEAQARLLARDVERAFAELRPGFAAIVDLSSLGTVLPEATEVLRKLAAVLAAAGLRQIVRVSGSSAAEATVARSLEGPYPTRVARTVEEAEMRLDAFAPQARPG